MQSGRAAAILHTLHEGSIISEPALLVVAHPDDESLGIGGRLATFAHLALIQLTDGAPRDGDDARRAGFPCWQRYAELREREACSAADRLGARLRSRICCGLADQESVGAIPAIVRLLIRLLADTHIIFTHPYEGGHPDHDTAALAVQRACEVLASTGMRPPLRFEFSSYHEAHGHLVAGRFWDSPACPAVEVRLSPESLNRKRQALACYATQKNVVAWFDAAVEFYRYAPNYDFNLPPPPGVALYDRFGWRITSALWRQRASAATLDAVGA